MLAPTDPVLRRSIRRLKESGSSMRGTNSKIADNTAPSAVTSLIKLTDPAFAGSVAPKAASTDPTFGESVSAYVVIRQEHLRIYGYYRFY
jgi:hypothetical protein